MTSSDQVVLGVRVVARLAAAHLIMALSDHLRARADGGATPTTATREPAPPALRYCEDCGAIHELGDHLPHRNRNLA